MDKVSVIIPIYNASTHLRKCVESLMRQTLEEVEYIFINDASTDDSFVILEDILNNYPSRHTKVIKLNENGGISNARNIGLKNATGEYITHCDSDDWIEPETYATLYHLAHENAADIVACNFVHEYGNYSRDYHQHYSSDMQGNMKRLLNGEIFPSLWSSMIKKDLIYNHNISFPKDLNMGEDLLFNVKSYYYANKIVHTNSFFYHYRHSENSVCVRRSRKSIDSDIAIAGLIEEFLSDKKCNHIYRQEILYRKFFSKLPLIKNLRNTNDYKEWLSIYPETNNYIWQYKRLKWTYRLELWFAANNVLPAAIQLKRLIKLQHRIKLFLYKRDLNNFTQNE